MTCIVQIICDRVKINLNYNISLPNNVDKYNFFISDYNNNIEYIQIYTYIIDMRWDGIFRGNIDNTMSLSIGKLQTGIVYHNYNT